MNDIVATVQYDNALSVVTSGTQSISVPAVGIQGPSGVGQLSALTDLDLTTLVNGSVLVYKTNTGKWTSTTGLNAQDMEGGEF